MIVYISNFMNHHQFPVASELYNLTKGNYRFIETESMPEIFKQSGYTEYDSLPYVIRCWKSTNEKEYAHNIILNASAVVYEAIDSIDIIKERLKYGKLTFECGERWLKRGLLNLLSPRLIKSQWRYHTFFYNKPLYRLCASAFASSDLRRMHSFEGKCFKWGYFTEFKNLDLENIIANRRKADKIKFITIARLVNWKKII